MTDEGIFGLASTFHPSSASAEVAVICLPKLATPDMPICCNQNSSCCYPASLAAC